MKLNFCNRFSKISQILNFMKNLPVGAELFNTDGQTDMKITVAFYNFSKSLTV